MSTDTPPSPEPEPYGPGSYMNIVRGRGHRPPMTKRNKVFLWVFLAIQAIFLGWTIYTGVVTRRPASASRSGCGPCRS